MERHLLVELLYFGVAPVLLLALAVNALHHYFRRQHEAHVRAQIQRLEDASTHWKARALVAPENQPHALKLRPGQQSTAGSRCSLCARLDTHPIHCLVQEDGVALMRLGTERE